MVLAGALLLASWLPGGPIRLLWDGLDGWFFSITNTSLGLSPLWDGLWAITNHRLFDLPAGLIMAALFLFSGRCSSPPRWATLLVHALIGALLGLLAQGLIHQWLDLSRLSPTLELPGSQRLSELTPWIRTKDASRGSFPGDHGLILFTLTLYGWRVLQPWARWSTASAAVLLTLPRLMSGAHWLTDILCGSIPVALVTVGLYGGLGLDGPIERRLVPVLEHWIWSLTPGRLRRWLDRQPRRRAG
jgi:Kdo2-lipid A phosphotransferase